MKLENVQIQTPETSTKDGVAHTEEVAQAIAVADVIFERIAVMRGGVGTLQTSTPSSHSSAPIEAGMEYSRRAGGGYQLPGAATGTANTSTEKGPAPINVDATRLADAILRAALQRGGFDGLAGPLTQPPSPALPVPQSIGNRSPHALHPGERTAQHDKAQQTHERPSEPRGREEVARDIVRPRLEGGEVRREDIARAISQLLSGVVDERSVKQAPAQSAERSDPARSPTEPGSIWTEQRHSDPKRETAAQERSTITPVDVQAILNDPRNDAARIIQQLLANDAVNRIPQGTTQEVAGRSQQSQNSQEQLPSQHPSVSTIQSSIGAHTDHLRDILQTVLDRTTPRPSNDADIRTQSQASPVGTTGDYTQFEAPVRNVPQSTDVQREGRSAPTLSNAGIEPSTIRIDPSTPGRGEQLARPVGLDGYSRGDSPTSPLNHAEQGRSMLRAIQSAAEKIFNIEALRKLDRALETAAISAAAAVTLGVIGAEVVAKEIFKVAVGLLELLRGEKEHNPTMESVIKELEEMCHDRGVEKIEKPAERVADITGVVVLSGSGLPVEGVIVDGGTLGLAITDVTGHFRFSNIPLDTGFALLIRDKNYTFLPGQIVGTVSGSDYYTVTATKN